MTDLVELLQTYLVAVARSGDGGGPRLYEPRPRGAVLRQLRRIVPQPVDTLVDLWSWHDGEEEPSAALFWGGSFPSLDRLEGEIDEIRAFLEEERRINEQHGTGWPFREADVVPILHAGLSYVLVGSGSSPSPGAVYSFSGGEGLPPLEMFPSLQEAIRAATFCVEMGYWVCESDGRFMNAPLRSRGVTPADLSRSPFD